MGNDYENFVMIYGLVPNILEEIITYLKTTYDYDSLLRSKEQSSYYGKVQIINQYKTAFDFIILTKNQPFIQLEQIFKKYENKIYIKNTWTDKDDGLSGVDIYSEKGHDQFIWHQPPDYYVNQIPTSWTEEDNLTCSKF